jgi:hypothetical protein
MFELMKTRSKRVKLALLCSKKILDVSTLVPKYAKFVTNYILLSAFFGFKVEGL